jgi:alpha-galactosidase/6-phospho-beta-glucosidase family protein
VTNQEMIAVAALEGDRRLALQAMANDPLVLSLQTARALLDDLLGPCRLPAPVQTRGRSAVA